MLGSILHTITERWYVVLFLISYLAIASYHWGLKRSLKFLVLGYFIAWASEASSIRNGFPYGDYTYRYENMPGEIFLYGVPVWDSVSYVFLNFASWMTALALRSRWNRYAPLQELQRSWKTVLLGAFLVMLLDIVIDPVANMGERWFLGDIYFYPHGGWYFGVPWTNFAGWFLVGLAIQGTFLLIDSLEGVPKKFQSVMLGVGLFLGIYFFNLGITVHLKEWKLAAASAGWGILLILLAVKKGSRKNLRDLI
jgi:uncharacterized membrane protein